MQNRLLTVLALGAIAIAGCNAETSAPPPAASSPTPSAATPQTAAEMAFVAVDEPTQGAASLMEENGENYLVLNEAFQTKQGPDVLVLLHKEAVPKNYNEANVLSLGVLQKISGTQRYAIPAGTNLADFRSVAIWCRKFNVTFAYANLP